MEHMEIIAKLKDLGAISEDRKQTIQLEDVAYMMGQLRTGETVKIYICDVKTSKIIDRSIKGG